MDVDESKKPQNSRRRQTRENIQRRQEKEQTGRTAEEGEEPRKELFPAQASSSSYVTFYSKERHKGKEARWKQQLVSLEERSMQVVATPQTARKQSSIPAEMVEISKQLEHQMQ